MLTIILPGYSPKNKEWANEVKNNLQGNIKGNILVHEWLHWKMGGGLKIKQEREKILLACDDEQEINFIAKSVGTRVLMDLIPKLNQRISKVILCGIPAVNPLYPTGLKILNKKGILVIQNTNDPFLSYSEVKDMIGKIDKEVRVEKKVAKNHDYPYYLDFISYLTK